MPYIKADDGRREKLQKGEPALTAGELNYQIFYYYKYRCRLSDEVDKALIKEYVDQFLGKKPSYQRYNDMTGCLIRCAREVKRRLGILAMALLDIIDSYDQEIADYEDKKVIENGDV